MKERPILFSAPMVRAILDGRKSQTRRIVKPQPHAGVRRSVFVRSGLEDGHGRELRCPHGVPGDRLWVRETWQHAPQDRCDCPQPSEPSPCDDWSNGTGCRSNRGEVLYRADVGNETEERSVVRLAHRHGTHVAPWRPSIHMPRWASRITLEVTGVRVERLQEISDADAMTEGVPFTELPQGQDRPDPLHRAQFADLWESINGPRSWEANPWVWVIEFRRLP